MLNWTRTNVEVPFLNGTRKETRHTATMPNGSVWSLRKADDLYFLYIDGEAHKHGVWFDSLKDGKAALERIAEKIERGAAHA